MVKKNREINILRGIAISAVVGIHVFSICVSNVTSGISSWLYLIFHSMLQFAVPTFAFISSVLLGYVSTIKQVKVLDFYKKKLCRIGIPLVAWSIIYLTIKVITHSLAINELISLKNWLFWIGLGKAYTHLYYLSVSMQLYLIAPALILLVKFIHSKTSKYDYLVVLCLSISIQEGIYYLNKYFIYQYFKYQATMVIWYWYIIIIGIWSGINYQRFKVGLLKFKAIIGLGYCFITADFIRYVIALKKGLPIDTAKYMFNWWLYALFTVLVLYIICIYINDKNKHNLVTKYIECVGDYSFGIYLMHPILTLVLRRLIKFNQPVLLFVVVSICYFGIIGVCIVAVKLLRKNRLTSIIIGEKKLIGT